MRMLKKQEQIRKLPFNSLGPQIELKIPRLLIFHQAEIKEISPAIHKLPKVTRDAIPMFKTQKNSGKTALLVAGFYPPTQKATASQTVDECGEGTLRSSERA